MVGNVAGEVPHRARPRRPTAASFFRYEGAACDRRPQPARAARGRDAAAGGDAARARRRSLFTSDLSVNEFLLVREAGFRPLGLVLGSSIYHVGFQRGKWSQNQELGTLTQAMYHARELAMSRMEAEADVLGADGIVGVRLEIEFKEFGEDLAEFIAVGTAVKADAPPPTGDRLAQQHRQAVHLRPVRSGLLDPARGRVRPARHGDGLLRLPHRPPGDVEVDGQHRPERRDPEVHRGACTTPASWRCRGCRRRPRRSRAEGIVGVQLLSLPHRWGGHTTEFFAIGTAVRPLRDGPRHRPPAAGPAADRLVSQPPAVRRPRSRRARRGAARRQRRPRRLRPGADDVAGRRAAGGHGRGRARPVDARPAGRPAGEVRSLRIGFGEVSSSWPWQGRHRSRGPRARSAAWSSPAARSPSRVDPAARRPARGRAQGLGRGRAALAELLGSS